MSQSRRAIEDEPTVDSSDQNQNPLRDLVRAGRSFSGRERHCSFLNTGKKRFANISAVSGIDYPDDGRGLALVDWDLDGDIDLWTVNRSSPQVRFLRNEGRHRHNYLALQLIGSTCNRDAIGARVSVVLEGKDTVRLIKTLRAGDGFQSQSSKTVHFGLGSSSQIERVEVHWPGGDVEVFADVAPNNYYKIVQGSGRSVKWQRPQRKITLVPTTLNSKPTNDAARVVLADPVPMPTIDYTDWDGSSRRPSPSRPTLINLWASWCHPCIQELNQLAANKQRLQAVDVDVLALSVDGLSSDSSTDSGDAKRLIEQIDFPFHAGIARPELLEKIDILQRQLFSMNVPLAVPTSFLLDREGNIVVIYRGAVDVDQLLDDVRVTLVAGPESRMRSVPFEGRFLRWVLPQPTRRAAAFHDAYPQEEIRYLQLAIAQYSSQLQGTRATVVPQQALKGIEATIRRRLSLLLEQQNNRDAIAYYEKLIQQNPDDAKSRLKLAPLYRAVGQASSAADQYRAVAALEPRDVADHVQIATALMQLGRIPETIEHYKEALRREPEHIMAANSLAWIYATHPDAQIRDGKQALFLATQACKMTENDQPVLLVTLAAAFAEVGQFDPAIETAQSAMEIAKRADKLALARELEGYLRLFRHDTPIREPAAEPPKR